MAGLLVFSPGSRRLAAAAWDGLDVGVACSGIVGKLPQPNGPKAFRTPSMLRGKLSSELSSSVLEVLSTQLHVSD